MNSIIEQMKNHRSIRQYLTKEISPEDLDQILEAGQCASTSCNSQAYSIVAVKDQEKKKELAALCGQQQHIVDCPVFLVFCADLHRIHLASQQLEESIHLTNFEPLLVASIDTALLAQNILLAAESMGIGGVFAGGIRNNSYEVSELLKLPQLVYPVFGMCLGYPDPSAIPGKKPRFSLKAIVHEEQYNEEPLKTSIQEYDQVMRHYYRERTGGQRDESWSEYITGIYRHPRRTHLRKFLESKGFGLD